MKRITCILCDKPAVHRCKDGNTLCADHLIGFRKSCDKSNSVSSVSPLSGASAAAAEKVAPGPTAAAVTPPDVVRACA